MFNLIRNRYKAHKITAEDVWAYADKKIITEEQATIICGPRPSIDT